MEGVEFVEIDVRSSSPDLLHTHIFNTNHTDAVVAGREQEPWLDSLRIVPCSESEAAKHLNAWILWGLQES